MAPRALCIRRPVSFFLGRAAQPTLSQLRCAVSTHQRQVRSAWAVAPAGRCSGTTSSFAA